MCGLTVRTSTSRCWLGKGHILPRCIPTTKGAVRPLWNPGAGRDPAPANGAFGAPLEPMDQGASPLEPDGGLSHPSTTRRSFRGPGTHEQERSCPCTLTKGGFMPLRSPAALAGGNERPRYGR